MKIVQGSRVSVTYELFDEKGRSVEAAEAEEPLSFVVGAGDVPPAVERALEGREVGEKLRLTLGPEEAFGAYDPAGLVSIPRDEVPADDLARGDWVPVQLVEDGEAVESDEDEDDFEMRVVEVSDDEVILDANHPLAGQEVTFVIEVLTIE